MQDEASTFQVSAAAVISIARAVAPALRSRSHSVHVLVLHVDHDTETALLTVRCYNNVEKKRSFYAVPLKPETETK